jgi:glycosyltransferase involved in cell wall biosynthesis
VVYAEAMGTFDGVEYRHHSAFKGCKADVFIASRTPWISEAPIEAKLRLLWLHDIGANCDPNSPKAQRWLYWFDRVLCLSRWHKDFFLSQHKTVHENSVLVTRNGIDPSRFATELPKTSSMVFSSSPNRGLQWLAPNFQLIRTRVPDAELHVFYGFDTWETMARQRGNAQELEFIAQFKALLPPVGQSRDGIFNHGKRSQAEVAQAYLRAKVWPYLTDFTETSCITAMEAQAAGCVPVCSAVAALPETVRHGFLFDTNDMEVGRKWVEKVVELLQREDLRGPVARAGREYAMSSLSWAAVARDWSAMFGQLIEEVSACPIPLWRAA